MPSNVGAFDLPIKQSELTTFGVKVPETLTVAGVGMPMNASTMFLGKTYVKDAASSSFDT